MGRPLGQHFLTDRKILKKIAAALDLSSGDLVLEIGPGHGELTSLLLSSGARVVAVEKDSRLAEKLKTRFSSESDFSLINADIRDFLPRGEYSNYKIAGNIPYYLTGRLLRQIGELSSRPSLVVLTIQKEVAERLVPSPDKFNLLAASVSWWGEPRIVFSISKDRFSPPPKVDSATILIKSKKSLPPDVSAEDYFRVVRAAFRQPRKLLLNNLSDFLAIPKSKLLAVFSLLKLPPNIRAQNLNFELLLSLVRQL